MYAKLNIACPLCDWSVERTVTGPDNPLPPVVGGLSEHLEKYHGWTLWNFLEWMSEFIEGEPALTEQEQADLEAAIREVDAAGPTGYLVTDRPGRPLPRPEPNPSDEDPKSS
jgi:hypothetical protein